MQKIQFGMVQILVLRLLQKLTTLKKIWDFVGQIQNKIFLKTIGMFGFKVLGKYAYFWVNCQEGFYFFFKGLISYSQWHLMRI
jgi:hypothetical protein